jgi:hypothetical protein
MLHRAVGDSTLQGCNMARRRNAPPNTDPIPKRMQLISEPPPVDPTAGPNPTHRWIKISDYEKHAVGEAERPDSVHREICRDLDSGSLLFRFKQVGKNDWQTKFPRTYRWRDERHARVDWGISSASWSAHTTGPPGLIQAVVGIEIYAIEILVPIGFPATPARAARFLAPAAEQQEPEPPESLPTEPQEPSPRRPMAPGRWVEDKIRHDRKDNEVAAEFCERQVRPMQRALVRGEVSKAWSAKRIANYISENRLWPE